VLGRGVTMTNPAASQMANAAKGWFMSHGMDAATATKQAYASIFGMVAQQASMAAFIYAFRLLAIIFICLLPLILIMKPPKHKGGGGAMAH